MIHSAKQLLSFSLCYKALQKLADGGLRKTFVDDYVKPKQDEKILDLGCGTGNLYPNISKYDVEYLGVDINPRYIKHAKKAYNTECFECEDVANLQLEYSFDKIICSSLLHHLSDRKFSDMLEEASKRLTPNGTFISIDPLYHENQTVLSYLMCKLDRGDYVRTRGEYYRLLSEHFKSVKFSFLGKISNVPTDFCIFECNP